MRVSLVLSVGLLAMLIACCGCSNSIVTPDSAHLSSSKNEEFPYQLRIQIVQKIRFNPHTFAPAHTDVPMECFLLLRRDSGTLVTGDFYFVSLAGVSPMPTRGTVVFSGSRVRVTAELATGGDAAKGWEALPANGDYLIVKE